MIAKWDDDWREYESITEAGAITAPRPSQWPIPLESDPQPDGCELPGWVQAVRFEDYLWSKKFVGDITDEEVEYHKALFEARTGYRYSRPGRMEALAFDGGHKGLLPSASC